MISRVPSPQYRRSQPADFNCRHWNLICGFRQHRRHQLPLVFDLAQSATPSRFPTFAFFFSPTLIHLHHSALSRNFFGHLQIPKRTSRNRDVTGCRQETNASQVSSAACLIRLVPNRIRELPTGFPNKPNHAPFRRCMNVQINGFT
jgi:hypothetical protein